VTINLTPVELREWADICSLAMQDIRRDQFARVVRLFNDIGCTVFSFRAVTPLALALADAMEELSAARKVIRLVTWESIAGANRRNGKEPSEQWRNFPDYGYYLADPDDDTYIECPIPDEHIPTVRAAYAEEHADGDD